METSTAQIISIILALISLIIILAVVIFTSLLRETNEITSPFSFSRFQLFLWTMVITPAFALHWGYNCPCEKMINTTALILLGISSSTMISSAIVASVQKSANPELLLKMNRTSKNFWTDILTDDNGQFSIFRLQQLIFTLIYITVFITTFFGTGKNYPEFDSTAYVLMGISTGSYVLGKALNR